MVYRTWPNRKLTKKVICSLTAHWICPFNNSVMAPKGKRRTIHAPCTRDQWRGRWPRLLQRPSPEQHASPVVQYDQNCTSTTNRNTWRMYKCVCSIISSIRDKYMQLFVTRISIIWQLKSTKNQTNVGECLWWIKFCVCVGVCVCVCVVMYRIHQPGAKVQSNNKWKEKNHKQGGNEKNSIIIFFTRWRKNL